MMKTKKEKMLKQARSESPGMTHVGFVDVPLEDIVVPDMENTARKAGESKKIIEIFRSCIRENEYDPLRYPPPVGVELSNGNVMLVSGNHRYKAHFMEEMETMTMQIVEFIDFGGETSEHWEKVWQCTENKPYEFHPKNDRTDADVVHVAANLLGNKSVRPTNKRMNKILKDLDIKPHQYGKFRTRILKELKHDAQVVKTKTQNDMKRILKFYENETGESAIGWLADRVNNRDYESRIVQDLIKFIQQYGKVPRLIGMITNSDEDQVPLIRLAKDGNLRKLVEQSVWLVRFMDENNYDVDDIIKTGLWLGQKYKEGKLVNRHGDDVVT